MGAGEGDFDASFAALFACGYRAAFRLIGSRADAEDLAIEAVARAQARWDEVGRYGEPWVVRTATNLALDQLRRGAPPAPRSGAVEDVLTTEHRVDLVRALRRLPRRQREVVLLRYIGDRSEREVAELLGISPGSVKQHASRGLASLRSNLTGYRLAGDADPGPDSGSFRAEEVDDVR
ncbi:MAG: sigma-70 family RNA polymerase sigma factor [Acidimicrobiales bacterium]